MSKQTWQETLAVQRAAGTLYDTYTTAKTVINPDALWTMPANYLDVGRRLRVTVQGALSNLVTTPGLVVFQVKIASVIAFTTGNIQLNATAHVLLPFWLEIDLTCRTVGSSTSATTIGLGRATGIQLTNTAAQVDDPQDMPTILGPATAPAVGTGFDSTIANIVDFWAGFTISNAANGVRIDQYLLESLN